MTSLNTTGTVHMHYCNLQYVFNKYLEFHVLCLHHIHNLNVYILILNCISKCSFLLVDYLYVADTRTRAIFEIRKRDGGGSVVVRQGVNSIMNIKAYTPDLHSSM